MDVPHVKAGVPYTDYKHQIKQYALSTWQGDWNGAVANKLHSLKQDMGVGNSTYFKPG